MPLGMTDLGDRADILPGRSRYAISALRRRNAGDGVPYGGEIGCTIPVGAIIDRPPKIEVFRIFRREITGLSPCGDGFFFEKSTGDQ